MRNHFLLFPAVLGLVLFSACGTPPDDDDSVTGCNLIAGDESPVVTIDEPGNGEINSVNDPINWLVRVEDEDSDLEGMGLIALDLSDGTPQEIDFELPETDANGHAEFTLSGNTLGDGVIVVRIEATDATGCTGDDQVVLCIDVPSSECEFD